ncbi:peptidase, S9A/B/C family, catalytic domain protein [Streptococcus sp. oral taxon 056 str. F0418]|uniref:alpha/beta hydrolase family protein n=1 Tax=Streptococcus sp. oral taxon 056 TaxID=712620 RepID=UPI00021812C8|nr:alpha/beta fold hydrolase [Streptococcus sp. oral taxon 056]EGP66581.1 peptidase, S9A/B/C family, catalytic domain protein [Streptococcus sp. oral taxon 056 str. F0418]
MKYIWAFLATLSLTGLALFFWHFQTKPNPTPPKPETTQTASSEKSDKQPTPTEDIVSEEYSISYDDKQLYGKITAPRDYKSKKLPTIVIAHGFNNTLEQYEIYSQLLAKQGYLVYSFDFYGGSRQSKSGGQDMLNMSVKTELTDLTQVMEKLRSETFVDKSKISLFSASQGGVVASLYAAAYPDRVHKLMLIFPAFVLFDDVQETYRQLGSPDLNQLPDSLTHRNATLGKIYLIDALNIDIQAEQTKITAPTLIIHGTDDAVVPYQYAVEASQTIPNAELVTVEGGEHRIDEKFAITAAPAIQKFLKE